mmetsp:Transcript_8267/g.25547  ORF Transcript_8267/g.25547 Transcript_8267/m.25547 type:complete len:250 (-) Transcript_8267:821-1570(-)
MRQAACWRKRRKASSSSADWRFAAVDKRSTAASAPSAISARSVSGSSERGSLRSTGGQTSSCSVFCSCLKSVSRLTASWQKQPYVSTVTFVPHCNSSASSNFGRSSSKFGLASKNACTCGPSGALLSIASNTGCGTCLARAGAAFRASPAAAMAPLPAPPPLTSASIKLLFSFHALSQRACIRHSRANSRRKVEKMKVALPFMRASKNPENIIPISGATSLSTSCTGIQILSNIRASVALATTAAYFLL